MANANFASAKAEFEKLRNAKTGAATPIYKPTFGTSGTTASGGGTAMYTSSAAGAGVGPLYQQNQITCTVGNPLANLVLPPGVPRLRLQPVSEPNPLPVISNLPALLASSIHSFQHNRHGPMCYNPLPLPMPNSLFHPQHSTSLVIHE